MDSPSGSARSRARRFLPVLLVAILGCAAYGSSFAPVLERLEDGDAKAALAHLERSPNEEDALYQLERGLLLRLAGRPAESQGALARAETISEELYTISVSRELAALATSDRLRRYLPSAHERLLARFYATLDAIDCDDLDGAAVEARRMEWMIDQRREGADPRANGVDALASLLAAVVFEAAGDPGSALVSYRRHLLFAEEAGVDPRLRPSVQGRLRSLASRLGIVLDPAECGGAEADSATTAAATRASGSAERVVLVVLEEGLITPRTEFSLDVPILEAEEERGREWLGPALRDRCLAIQEGRWVASQGLEVSYWLEVALPTYPAPPPPPEAAWIRSGGVESEMAIVADLETEVRAQLSREFGGIALRAVLRSLLKWSVHRQAEERAGEVAGVLANVVGVATEAAETRTWLTLPRAIRVALLVETAPADSGDLEVRRADTGPFPMGLRWPGEGSVGFGLCRHLR